MRSDTLSGASFGAGVGILTTVGVMTVTAGSFVLNSARVLDARALDSFVAGVFSGVLGEMMLRFDTAPAMPGFSGIVVGVAGSLLGVLDGTVEKIGLVILGTIIGGGVIGFMQKKSLPVPAGPFEVLRGIG